MEMVLINYELLVIQVQTHQILNCSLEFKSAATKRRNLCVNQIVSQVSQVIRQTSRAGGYPAPAKVLLQIFPMSFFTEPITSLHNVLSRLKINFPKEFVRFLF